MKKRIILMLVLILVSIFTMFKQVPVYAKGNSNILVAADNNCETLLGTDYKDPDEPIYYVVLAFDIIKYAAIIILIVMSSVDFLQAVASHDEDAINKAVKKIRIRALMCVGIFVLPILLKFVLNLIQDTQICGIVD